MNNSLLWFVPHRVLYVEFPRSMQLTHFHHALFRASQQLSVCAQNSNIHVVFNAVLLPYTPPFPPIVRDAVQTYFEQSNLDHTVLVKTDVVQHYARIITAKLPKQRLYIAENLSEMLKFLRQADETLPPINTWNLPDSTKADV